MFSHFIINFKPNLPIIESGTQCLFFDNLQEMKHTENVSLVIILNPPVSNNKQIIEFLRCLSLSSDLGWEKLVGTEEILRSEK